MFKVVKTSVHRLCATKSTNSHNQTYLPKLVKTIQLVKQLHECPLDFTVCTGSLAKTTSTNGINLIHKYDAWLYQKKLIVRNYIRNLRNGNCFKQYELLLGDHVHNQTFPVSILHFHLYIYQLLRLILPISTTKVNIKFQFNEQIKQEDFFWQVKLNSNTISVLINNNKKFKPSKNWHLCCLQLLWLIMSFPYQEVHREEHPETFDKASPLIFFFQLDH